MNIQPFHPRTPRRADVLAVMLAALAMAVGVTAQAAPPPAPAPSPSHQNKLSQAMLDSPKQLAPPASAQTRPMLKAKQATLAPRMSDASRYKLKSVLVSPAQLGVSYDAKVCTMRAGSSPQGPSCASLNDGGNVAMLSWIWAPCSHANCVKNISGYRIYHPGTPVYTALPGHAGGHRTALTMHDKLVATVSPSQMAYGLATFKPGDCFVVRAYTNGLDGQPAQESADSDKFCLQRGMRIGTRKVELTSLRWKQSSYGVSSRPDKAAGCVASTIVTGFDPFGLFPTLSAFTRVVARGGVIPDVIVGHREIYTHRTFGCDTNAVVFLRSGVDFDTSQIANQPVSHATLSFDLAQGQWSGDASTPQALPISCATQVGRATADWEHGWPAKSGAIPGTDFVPLPHAKQRVDGPLQVDVTSIVQGWATVAPNHGFVLSMDPKVDETHHAQNSTCLSKYDHFKLTVVVPRTL